MAKPLQIKKDIVPLDTVLDYDPSNKVKKALPTDKVLSAMYLRFSGSVVMTFASGTPLPKITGSMDAFISLVVVETASKGEVKAVRPHLTRLLNNMQSANPTDRRSSAGASAVAQPTADANFTFASTTNITSVVECIKVNFEMPFAASGRGRELTMLDLRQESSANIRIDCAALANILAVGNTAPIVATADTFQVEVLLECVENVPTGFAFSTYREFHEDIQVAAETASLPINITKGNRIAGLALFCTDGYAGGATADTGNAPTNYLVQTMQLKRNSKTDEFRSTFKETQTENRRAGLVAPFASNRSAADGFAYINLLKNQDLSTALDASFKQLDSLKLYVKTGPAADVSYAGPANINLMTHEIVDPS